MTGTRIPTPKFFEIVPEERMNGQIFTHTVDSLVGPMEALPVCFRCEKQAEDDFLLFLNHTHKRNPEGALELKMPWN